MSVDARDLRLGTQVRLWNGAVITKTVTSHHGEPHPWTCGDATFSDQAVTQALAEDATILDNPKP